MSDPIPLCDPHFHLWDLAERANPNLGDPPPYRAGDYFADMATLPDGLERVAGVHVETVVGQKEGGVLVDTVSETEWVCDQLQPTATEQPFGLVAYVHLARDTTAAERTLDAHLATAGKRLRGVRMILNHHPKNSDLIWPQVEDGIFTHPLFREGLALLQRRGLAYDLSCNPHQILDAVAVLKDFPDLPIVTNHLGFLHDGEDQAHEDLWRQSMAMLAELPHAYMKLSMAWFAREDYHQNAAKETKIGAIVRELIELFGIKRCMFASNYPVDKFKGQSIHYIYTKFLAWSADLSADERKTLFHDTAIKAYGAF